MQSKTIKIQAPEGLHLRPAGTFCQKAIEYSCKIELRSGTIHANAKSVLSVLGACINQGCEVELICDGIDEKEAIRELSLWMEENLGE